MSLRPFKLRHFLLLAAFLLIAAALLYGLRQCRGGSSEQPYAPTEEDLAAVKELEAGIQRDSLRREAEREARYDSMRAVWREQDEARREKYRKDRPLSARAKEYLADRQRWDSVRAARPEKYAEGTVLDLTSVDSLSLLKVPLVGPARAAQILSYGRQLGGYVSAQQILEINNMPPEMARWFKVSGTPHPRRLKINSADFKTLVRHPYLSFEQVKEIFRYRQRYGALKDWNDLALSPVFTPDDFKRLAPYSDFH